MQDLRQSPGLTTFFGPPEVWWSSAEGLELLFSGPGVSATYRLLLPKIGMERFSGGRTADGLGDKDLEGLFFLRSLKVGLFFLGFTKTEWRGKAANPVKNQGFRVSQT